MAEPTTPRRPGVKLAERDGLLATKLHIPRPRAGLLSRARLLERLTEGMAAWSGRRPPRASPAS
jgi:hypothetical protein